MPLPRFRDTPLFWPPLVAVVALLLALAATAAYQWVQVREQRQQQRIQDTLWLRQYLLFQLEDLNNKLRSEAERLAHPNSSARLSEVRSFLMRQHPELVHLTLQPGEAAPACDPVRPWSWETPSPAARLFCCHPLGSGTVLLATIDLSRLLSQAPWWVLQHYRATLFDLQGESVARVGETSGAEPEARYRVQATLPGAEWIVELAGNPPVLPAAQRWLLSAAVVLALIAAVAIGYAARATRARVAALQALADEVAFRRAMENSLTVGLRARDRAGKILYVNEAFCAMTGFRAEELIGRTPPMPYWDPEHREATEALHRQILAGEGPTHGFEILFRRKDGRPLEALIFEAPLVDGRGEQIGWMASVIDVTEARQRERELEWQRSRLATQARLVTLGEMAAAIAHELNQPLLAIASYASGARHLLAQISFERTAPAAVSHLAEALEAIERQALRAGGIIQRIRQFTRHREPRTERQAIAPLIAEVVELVTPLARRQRVRLDWHVPPELDATVDPILLQQAVANLLINAIEAASDATATQPLVLLSATADDQALSICVRDWGPGVAPTQTGDNPEPFVTTKPDGLGLGLWIARSVVAAHRGHFTLRPHPEGGSEARLSFPRLPLLQANEDAPHG